MLRHQLLQPEGFLTEVFRVEERRDRQLGQPRIGRSLDYTADDRLLSVTSDACRIDRV